jgi:hypothetical protein
MTTDISTLPPRALTEPDLPTESHRPGPPIATEAPSAARPRRSRYGAWRALRQLLNGDGQQPARDHLLLLGPSGGPLWTSRTK